jgi:hypothetical protein
MSLSDGNEDREPNLAFTDSTTDIWRSEFGELLDRDKHRLVKRHLPAS